MIKHHKTVIGWRKWYLQGVNLFYPLLLRLSRAHSSNLMLWSLVPYVKNNVKHIATLHNWRHTQAWNHVYSFPSLLSWAFSLWVSWVLSTLPFYPLLPPSFSFPPNPVAWVLASSFSTNLVNTFTLCGIANTTVYVYFLMQFNSLIDLLPLFSSIWYSRNIVFTFRLPSPFPPSWWFTCVSKSSFPLWSSSIIIIC